MFSGIIHSSPVTCRSHWLGYQGYKIIDSGHNYINRILTITTIPNTTVSDRTVENEMWTLENKATCIIHTLSYGPKWCSFIIQTDPENQDTLIIRTLMIGPKVSIIHRFHCNKNTGQEKAMANYYSLTNSHMVIPGVVPLLWFPSAGCRHASGCTQNDGEGYRTRRHLLSNLPTIWPLIDAWPCSPSVSRCSGLKQEEIPNMTLWFPAVSISWEGSMVRKWSLKQGVTRGV